VLYQYGGRERVLGSAVDVYLCFFLVLSLDVYLDERGRRTRESTTTTTTTTTRVKTTKDEESAIKPMSTNSNVNCSPSSWRMKEDGKEGGKGGEALECV